MNPRIHSTGAYHHYMKLYLSLAVSLDFFSSWFRYPVLLFCVVVDPEILAIAEFD